MVFELVKNSLRAVQERFMDSDNVAPPVRIIVADGLEDVTIKVCASLRLSGQIVWSCEVFVMFLSDVMCMIILCHHWTNG